MGAEFDWDGHDSEYLLLYKIYIITNDDPLELFHLVLLSISLFVIVDFEVCCVEAALTTYSYWYKV